MSELKCPACNEFVLESPAWISTEDGGVRRSYDHYDCVNCGPVPKEYVEAVIARLAAAEAKPTSAVPKECDNCGYSGHDLPKWRKILQDAAKRALVPHEREYSNHMDDYDRGSVDGWNACRDAMLAVPKPGGASDD